MGLTMPTLSVLLLAYSPVREQGVNGAAIQAADMVGSVFGVTVAASLANAVAESSFSWAIGTADAVFAIVALAGAGLSPRAAVAESSPIGSSSD
jgi:hypothetical protein